MSEQSHQGPPADELIDENDGVIALYGDGPPLFVDHAFVQLKLALFAEPIGAFEIVSGLDWPGLNARFVLVQPDVVATEPRRGWIGLGGAHATRLALGRRDSLQFDFGADAPIEPQLLLCAEPTFLSLTACRGATIRIEVARNYVLSASDLPTMDYAEAAA